MPDSELEALMIIFVPAAVAGGIPKGVKKEDVLSPMLIPQIHLIIQQKKKLTAN